MISLRELLFSRTFGASVGFAVALIVFLSIMWFRHFKRVGVIHLNIANLLSTISLGITGVSILLPATGALLFYYLSQITAEKLFTSYGLVIAIGYFGLSLLIGLWNAFSLATQYEGGENAEWTGGDIIHALFFGAQFVCFIIGVGLVMCFFFTVSLNVESLLKKAS